MAASMNDVIQVACDDFMQFENALKEIRQKDDSIIYELNNTVPTKSFKVDTAEKCKSFYEQLTNMYSARERAIKICITSTSREVNDLRSLRTKEENQDNPEVLRQLRNSQTKLRMMQRELSVEEVVKDRSWKGKGPSDFGVVWTWQQLRYFMSDVEIPTSQIDQLYDGNQ